MSSVREYDEKAELIDDPELEAGIEELERGEWVDGDEVLRRLHSGEYDAPADRRTAR